MGLPIDPLTYTPGWEWDGVGWLMRVPMEEDLPKHPPPPRFGSPHHKPPPPVMVDITPETSPQKQAYHPSMEWKIGGLTYDHYCNEQISGYHAPKGYEEV